MSLCCTDQMFEPIQYSRKELLSMDSKQPIPPFSQYARNLGILKLDVCYRLVHTHKYTIKNC